MRTTIDLPDELFRQVKARAALDGLKLKDLITRYVERGLRGETAAPREPVRLRRELPIAQPPIGEPLPRLSNADLYRILDDEDAARILAQEEPADAGAG